MTRAETMTDLAFDVVCYDHNLCKNKQSARADKKILHVKKLAWSRITNEASTANAKTMER